MKKKQIKITDKIARMAIDDLERQVSIKGVKDGSAQIAIMRSLLRERKAMRKLCRNLRRKKDFWYKSFQETNSQDSDKGAR